MFIYHVSDSFLETNFPLTVLVEAASRGGFLFVFIYHVSDSFLETNFPLTVLVEAASRGGFLCCVFIFFIEQGSALRLLNKASNSRRN